MQQEISFSSGEDFSKRWRMKKGASAFTFVPDEHFSGRTLTTASDFCGQRSDLCPIKFIGFFVKLRLDTPKVLKSHFQLIRFA